MTNPTEQQSKILTRVQKLLDLASGEANANESNEALAKAQELISQYNLEELLAMYEPGQTKKALQVVRKDYVTDVKKWQPIDWKLTLWTAITKSSYCKGIVMLTEPYRTFVALGLPDQCDRAWWMYQKVVAQCEALATTTLPRLQRQSNVHPQRLRNGFLVGLATGLYGILMSRMEDTVTVGTALVLHKEVLDEFSAMEFPKMFNRPCSQVDRTGFSQGRESANQIRLNTELETQTRQITG